MWEIAKACGNLDVNSSYAYVLWTRDFAATTAIAREGDAVIGYCLGYLRPDRLDTYFVWQIAVLDSHRGRGIAHRLLDEVTTRCGARSIEATIDPANGSSTRFFRSFARQRGHVVETAALFRSEDFPGSHPDEDLIRFSIG